MWSVITSGVISLVKSWFDIRQAKAEATAEYHRRQQQNESDWDARALEASKHSWKDEYLLLVWTFPLIYAWYDPDKAMEWISFVDRLPLWYQCGLFGMMAATFGLRWWFKRENFKVNATQKP